MTINQLKTQADNAFIKGNYQEAVESYQKLIENEPNTLNNYWYLGLVYLLNQQENEAENIWMSVIFESLEKSDNLTAELINFLDEESLRQIELGNVQNAVIIYEQIKQIEPNYQNLSLKLLELINLWIQEASDLLASRNLKEAQNKYELLITIEPQNALIWCKLAVVYHELFQYPLAYQTILKALELDNRDYISYYNAGVILEKLNLFQEAINFYQQAISLNPQHIESYNNLGNLLVKLNQLEMAENLYKNAIATNRNHYGSYINLGNLLVQKEEIKQALETYKQAIILSKDTEIFYWVVNNIRSFNYIQEAINFATDNAYLFPDNLLVQIERYRILPFLYKNPEEIDYYRQRLSYFFEQLLTNNSLNSQLNLQESLNLINRHTNFHLHYQAKNDLEMQIKYGKFIQQVMSQNYPQFSQPISPPYLTKKNPKIRVGYISYCLRNHVVGRLSLGWLKNHNSEKFEIYCYYLGDNSPDVLTQQFEKYSDKFYHFSEAEKLESICQKIINHQLDILVFIDLPMYPKMTLLGGLKLAPIQCVAWLHPITSGIPTIDYFISSELMEGENAENHYSEKLIKLPNLSVCFPKNELPKITKDRSKFHLNNENIVYLSSQFPSKYLPQYDYLFPSIAQQVNHAKFIFIHPKVHKGKTELINHQLWARIKQAFTNHNLSWENYCLFLPTITNANDYWQLFSVCDVFLDTIGFTGFNSTLDAIESFLPVVTYSGEFFRTRQSEGILKMIKVTETIAKSESDYIDIAVKLGLNFEFRTEIVNKIKQNLHLLYNDLKPVKALENFYQNILETF